MTDEKAAYEPVRNPLRCLEETRIDGVSVQCNLQEGHGCMHRGDVRGRRIRWADPDKPHGSNCYCYDCDPVVFG